MRIAIIADVHLGVHRQFNDAGQRTYRIFKALRRCIRSAKSRADAIVIAGDLLDKRKGVDVAAAKYVRSLNQLLQHTLDLPVFILEGNHEYISSEHSVLDFIMNSDRIHVVRNESISMTNNVILTPYVSNEESMINGAIELARKLAKVNGQLPYMIGHFMLTDALLSGGYRSVTGVRANTLQRHFSKVILGDVHKRQKLSYRFDERTTPFEVYYVGAPIQHNFGDCDNPVGYALLDMETGRVSYVNTHSGPYFYKFSVDNDADENAKRVDPKNFFWFACASKRDQEDIVRLVPQTINFITTVQPKEKSEVRLSTVKARKSLSAIAKEYIEVVRKDIETDDKGRIHDLFVTFEKRSRD